MESSNDTNTGDAVNILGTKAIYKIIIGVVILGLIIFFIYFFVFQKKNRKQIPENDNKKSDEIDLSKPFEE